MRRIVLVIIAIAFLLNNSIVSNSVRAEIDTNENEFNIDVENLIDTENKKDMEEFLSEDNIILEDIEIFQDTASIETSLKANQNEIIYADIDIQFEDSTAVARILEEDEEQVEYSIDLIELNDDRIVFEYTDKETGKIEIYDSTLARASIAPAIPIGIAITSAAFKALIDTASLIIVSGAAYIVATKAIPKVNKNKKKKQYNHFAATLHKGKLYIGKGLTKKKAIVRAKKSKNVWSTSKNQAKLVAAGANKSGKPIHEIDKNKKGKYYHWHPYKRTPKMHSFYGKAQ